MRCIVYDIYKKIVIYDTRQKKLNVFCMIQIMKIKKQINKIYTL
jgi:hypothetical protein